MTFQINTPSSAIKAWRVKIEDDLSNPRKGYLQNLESEAQKQYIHEQEWLSDSKLFHTFTMPSHTETSIPSHVSETIHFYSSSVLPAAFSSSLSPSAKKAIPTQSEIVLATLLSSSTFQLSNSLPFSTFVKMTEMLNEVRAASIKYSDINKKVASGQFRKLSTSLPNISIKFPVGTNSASLQDLLHEGFINIFGTNSLRHQIPNFPLVYGVGMILADPLTSSPGKKTKVFEESSPRRGRGTDSFSVSHTAEIPYLITESFQDSSTLADHLRSNSLEATDFLSVIIQLSLALNEAHQLFDFTHYDLSADRIRLVPLPETAYIPYRAGTLFIASKFVAVITDFGFSHITAVNANSRKIHFGFSMPGKAKLVQLGIFRDRSNPMTDIYRLLLTCAAVIDVDHPLMPILTRLIQYFNQTETLATILTEQASNYFCLPPAESSRGYDFNSFLNFIAREVKSQKWVKNWGTLYHSSKTLRKPPATAQLFPAGSSYFSGLSDFKNLETVIAPSTSLLDFVEMYSKWFENDLEEYDDFDIIFKKRFIKNFTQKTSDFHAALAETDRVINKMIILLDEIQESFCEEYESYSTAPGRLAASLGTEIKAEIYLSEVWCLAQHLRAFAYVKKMYWEDVDLPGDVVSVLDRGMAKLAETVQWRKVLVVLINRDLERIRNSAMSHHDIIYQRGLGFVV